MGTTGVEVGWLLPLRTSFARTERGERAYCNAAEGRREGMTLPVSGCKSTTKWLVLQVFMAYIFKFVSFLPPPVSIVPDICYLCRPIKKKKKVVCFLQKAGWRAVCASKTHSAGTLPPPDFRHKNPSRNPLNLMNTRTFAKEKQTNGLHTHHTNIFIIYTTALNWYYGT